MDKVDSKVAAVLVVDQESGDLNCEWIEEGAENRSLTRVPPVKSDKSKIDDDEEISGRQERMSMK